jgi:malonyl-CoA O-methyltransferase
MSLDPRRIAATFGAAAGHYDAAAVLQSEVGAELVERAALLTHEPARIVDVGAGTGRLTAQLRKRLRCETIAIDLSLGMLQSAKRHAGWWKPFARVQGDAAALPLADQSVDLVFSNLCLQWCDDLPAALLSMRRVLRPGGWLLFSTFGPDTLKELRAAFSAVDDAPHVHRFLDMHDVGDAVLAQGFADPMLDVEHYTLTYASVTALMRDLKAIGARNAHRDRRRGLMGRQALRALEAAYEPLRHDGKLPASYEVVFCQAQAPQAGAPLKTPSGDLAQFGIEDMRARLRRR